MRRVHTAAAHARGSLLNCPCGTAFQPCRAGCHQTAHTIPGLILGPPIRFSERLVPDFGDNRKPRCRPRCRRCFTHDSLGLCRRPEGLTGFMWFVLDRSGIGSMEPPHNTVGISSMNAVDVSLEHDVESRRWPVTETSAKAVFELYNALATCRTYCNPSTRMPNGRKESSTSSTTYLNGPDSRLLLWMSPRTGRSRNFGALEPHTTIHTTCRTGSGTPRRG